MGDKTYINGVEVRGYAGLPPLAKAFTGPAMVVGTAPGWDAESMEGFRQVKDMHGVAPVVFAVNNAGRLLPEGMAQHWVTVHPEVFYRDESPLDRHSDKRHPGATVEWVWPIATMGGSSSLLAVMIAIVMGFQPVVTAGVHLGDEYKRMQGRWVHYRNGLQGRVCSVSPAGTFVRDFFGGLDGSTKRKPAGKSAVLMRTLTAA